MKTTILNVDNFDHGSYTGCHPATDSDPTSLYTGAITSWSVLLVLATLLVLCTIQYCDFKLNAIRRDMVSFESDQEPGWGEEVYTIWLSNLPPGVTTEELKLFLVQSQVTSEPWTQEELSGKVYSWCAYPSPGCLLQLNFMN